MEIFFPSITLIVHMNILCIFPLRKGKYSVYYLHIKLVLQYFFDNFENVHLRL